MPIRKKPSTKGVRVRNIPEPLHTRFKARTATEQTNINAVMLLLMASYADRGLPPTPLTTKEWLRKGA